MALGTWLCFPGSLVTQTATATPTTNSAASLLRLQREREEKTEGIHGLGEEIKTLNDYRDQMENRKGAAAKLTVRTEVQQKIENMTKLLKDLRRLTGVVNREDPRIAELKRIYTDFPSTLSEALDTMPTSGPRGRPTPQPPIIARTIEALGQREPDGETPLPQEGIEKLVAKLAGEADETEAKPSPAKLKWELLKKEIETALGEIEKIDQQLPKDLETYKAKLAEYYTNIVKGLDAERTTRQTNIKLLEDEREKKEAELAKAGEKQADINTLLVYAVYAMVLAIVTLFLLLRFFPTELARSIVVERTMIELLSMGFLLLTVIILGTGKLIGAETLGALLGTIAGYIFGQKQGERRGATEERAKMVDLLRSSGDVPAASAEKQ